MRRLTDLKASAKYLYLYFETAIYVPVCLDNYVLAPCVHFGVKYLRDSATHYHISYIHTRPYQSYPYSHTTIYKWKEQESVCVF